MTFPAMSLAEAHARLTAPGEPFEVGERVIDGVRRRVWVNGVPTARTLVEGARTFGARDFLVLGDVRITFAAFHRAVAALAYRLRADGVVKGERVAIAMRNLPEWPVAFYAALSLGAIATPLNAWWTGDELRYALADSGARHLIADAERLQRIGDVPQGVTAYVTAEAPGSFQLDAVIGAASTWSDLPDTPLPAVALDTDDDATLFYTSGTTGDPKGVLASHRAMLSNITGAAFAGARAALRRGEASLTADGLPPPAATLMAIPFFHVTGSFAILSPALHAGTTLVLMRRWDAGEALRLIERERVSWVVGVPTIAMQLAEHPDVGRHDLSSLVSLGYGGAAAAPELIGRLASALPAAAPGHGWGMTETSGLATTHAADDYRARPTSCGAPIATVDIQVRGEDGVTVLARDKLGELWVSGPNVMRRYWNRPDATAATLVDGWLRTGDLARIDADGFLHIVDRAKDVIIRGGENIHCLEVENALYAHPDVIDAALVGLPDRMLGEVPAAAVSLRPDAAVTTEALRAHVAERIAGYKVPIRIVALPAPLPRNAAGKLLRQDIRALVAATG